MQRSILPPSAPRLQREPLKSREILTLLAAIALIIATLLLGRWQLGRAETKRALEARIDARLHQPALVQGPRALNLAADAWSPVVARGTYAADWTVFLQNRQHDGQPGFWVLTPMRIEPGNTWVMVQRGWIPRSVDPSTLLPRVTTPSGVVDVHGRLAPPPSQWFAFAKDPPDAIIRQNVQLGAFAALHHVAMLPYVIQEIGGSRDGLVRDWPRADLGMQTNYGYAAQWWSMSALGIVLTVYFMARRLRRTTPPTKESDA